MASWVTPIGRTPSSRIRAAWAGMRGGRDRRAGTDQQVERADGLVLEQGGQLDPCRRLRPGELLGVCGSVAGRARSVWRRSATAASSPASPASRATRAAAPGTGRDAGEATVAVHPAGHGAVGLAQGAHGARAPTSTASMRRPAGAARAAIARGMAMAGRGGPRRRGRRRRGEARDARGAGRLVTAGLGTRVGHDGHRARLEERRDLRGERAAPAQITGAAPCRRAAATSAAASRARGLWRRRSRRPGARRRLRPPEARQPIGEGSSVVERDRLDDLPAGRLRGASRGRRRTARARRRRSPGAPDVARYGTRCGWPSPIRASTRPTSRGRRRAEPRDEVPAQLGGAPGGRLGDLRHQPPSASDPADHARLGPGRADVDEQCELGRSTDASVTQPIPSQSPRRKAIRSISRIRRERSR